MVLHVDSVVTEHHAETAGLVEQHAPSPGDLPKLDTQDTKHKDKLESTKKKLA